METKNQPNATCIQISPAQRCESVDILFGLTPREVYYTVGHFFDLPRLCSVALMEMLDAIQQGFEANNDVSELILFTKTMKIMVDMERLNTTFFAFSNYFHADNVNPNWMDALNDSGKNDELRKDIMALHYGLLDIVSAVDKMTFVDFCENAASCFAEITTKRAADDIVRAMSCVQAIYIAYIKNLHTCRVKQCVIDHKN